MLGLKVDKGEVLELPVAEEEGGSDMMCSSASRKWDGGYSLFCGGATACSRSARLLYSTSCISMQLHQRLHGAPMVPAELKPHLSTASFWYVEAT